MSNGNQERGAQPSALSESDVFAVGQRASELLPAGFLLADGRLVIQRLVGRGAMGVVYAALDHERNRVVALKTLRMVSSESAYSLKQEFRLLRDLIHPNLIRLHELFADGDQAFFTMDLVDGEPFDRALRPRPMPDAGAHPQSWSRLRAALSQLVSAVLALHQAGRLHRDLKPGNVLIDRTDQLVVLDFGLARQLHQAGRAASPNSSQFAGTPRYMAPELFHWQPATQKTDWYSVGVMVFEVLTGLKWRDAGVPSRDSIPKPPSAYAPGIPLELDRLCLALLDPDPQKRAGGAELMMMLKMGTDEKNWSDAPVPTARLVGRDAQLSQLHSAYEQARSGGVHAALVSGVSGMGKSSLLSTFTAQLSSEALVLSGSCREQEEVSHKALDEVVDGLADLLLGEDPEVVLELIPPASAPALLRLFPLLARVEVISALALADDSADPRDQRDAAYAALAGCLARLSCKRPLVIAIDDLQWGDVDSARLLYEVFCTVERFSCLLLLSYRSDEAAESACLQRLLSGSRCLADVLDVKNVTVGPLSTDESELLARQLLLSNASQRVEGQLAQQVRAVCAEAEGSPLLLHELASHRRRATCDLQREVKLTDVVRDRLDRVPAHGRQLFELVCVAGAPVRQAVLERAAPGVDINQTIIVLAAERLVRVRHARARDSVEPAHDAIRSVGIESLSDRRHREVHQQLAQAYSECLQPDVEALARHAAGAGLHLEAARWADRAAELNAARFAFDRAADLYRMALRHEPDTSRRLQLSIHLAKTLADAGRSSEAAPLFMEVAVGSSPRQALDYRQRAAEQWLVSGHVDRGMAVLRDVLREMGVWLPESRSATIVSLITSRLRTRWRGLDFVEAQENEVDARTLLRIDACRAAWALSFVSALHGTALQARYLLYALEAGEPYRVALGLGMEAVIRSSEGDRVAAKEIQRRGKELAERSANPHAIAFQHLAAGHCAYLSGDWGGCADAAERADESFTQKCRGSTWELNTLRFFWANALANLGRYRELKRRLTPWLLDSEDRGDLYARAGFRLVSSYTWRLSEDDPVQALEDIRVALDEWNQPALGVHRFLAEIARAQVMLYQGQAELAGATLNRLWREFRRSTLHRVQLCRVHMHHHTAFACLAMAAIDGRRRPQHLAQATRHVAGLKREAVPWGLAVCRYAEAQLLCFDGQQQAAIPVFEDAAEKLNVAGMTFRSDSVRYASALMRGTRDQEYEQLAARMSAQGVVRPERLMKMFAPGY